MSTFHDLPAELISHMMIFVVLGPACFPITEDEPRLQLTQVCTAWRKIAFDTPLIWDLRFPASYSDKTALKLANYWWSQSSGSQLLLLINPIPLQGTLPRSSRLFEKMVLPFTQRLGVIRINLNCAGLARFLALPPHSFPGLRKISVWLQDVEFNHTWKKSASSLEAAPLLHSVCFSFPAQAQFKPPLPWRQLTRLVLVAYTSGSELLTMLSRCPNLEDGVFLEISEFDPESVAEIEALSNLPLHLPKLTQLSIRFACSSFYHVTSRLILPNLAELQFACSPSRVDPSPEFVTFLQPMKASLRHLEMRAGLAWTSNNVSEAILENAPQLRSFIIPPRHLILPTSLERISQGILLREVERMQFGVYKMAQVVDMLRARKANSLFSIKEITVRSNSGSADVKEELEELRSQGVVIEVID